MRVKIAVMGFSGSGKSTAAKQLGTHYQIPVLHLDTVEYTLGWQKRDRDEALQMVTRFMEQSSWVIDGNYRAFFQDRRLEEADLILCLHFSRFCCFYRAVKRYFTFRDKTRDDMADGCIEKLDLEFVWWILHAGRTPKIKARFREIAEQHNGKTVVFKTQRQVNAFLRQL